MNTVTGVLNSNAFIVSINILFLYFILKIKTFFSKNNELNDEKELTENTKKPERIEIVIDSCACEKACTELKDHCKELSALGFDLEWNNEFGLAFGPKVDPVALLQLASCKGLCCLFRLNILKNIPTELRQILEDPNIVKVGIDPICHAELLEKDYSVQVQTVLDLRFLYPNMSGGIFNISENILEISLKNRELTFSNWEAPELTKTQELYAAMDCYVNIEIFKKWLIDEKINSLEYSNLLYTRSLSGFYDKNFIHRNKLKTCQNSLYNNEPDKNLLYGHQVRKKPLYDNCFMHAPDGELLCSCNKSKAQWYIAQGLAEIFLDEPFSIKLLFEPAARANKKDEGRFYQQLKNNYCVMCGDKKNCIRFRVVPQEYRKHFPKIMKSHQSHDIVLLCVPCHHATSFHYRKLKKQLTIICNAPFNNQKVKQTEIKKKIRNYGKALLKSGEKIPVRKKTVMENEIKNFFQVAHLTINELQKAASLEITPDISHGIKVTEYFSKQSGGLMEFEKLWRKYFLTKMKPKYLPALWSIDHNHSTLIFKESS